MNELIEDFDLSKVGKAGAVFNVDKLNWFNKQYIKNLSNKELVEKAIANQPDIIILNSLLSGRKEIVQSLRFEKGLENVLFLIYQ